MTFQMSSQRLARTLASTRQATTRSCVACQVLRPSSSIAAKILLQAVEPTLAPGQLSQVSRKRRRMQKLLKHSSKPDLGVRCDVAETSRTARLRARLQSLWFSKLTEFETADLLSVLVDQTSSLESIINRMDRFATSVDGNTTVWPGWLLDEAFRMRATPESLLRMLPYVTARLDALSPMRQAELLGTAIKAYGKFSMLAPVTAMLEQFLTRRDALYDKMARDPARTLPLVPLVKALAGIGKSGNASASSPSSLSSQHRSIISNAVLRLCLHYLSLPSSQQKLPAELIPVVLSSSVITPALRRIILDDADAQQLRLSPAQEKAAFTSAVRERDEDGALRLWRRMHSRKSYEGVKPDDLQDSELLGILMLAWAQGSYAAVSSIASDLKLFDRVDSDESHHAWRPWGVRALDQKRVAWGMRATRAAEDQGKDAAYLMRLSERIPSKQMDRRTLTSILRGLILRDDYERAWQLWQAMVERERRRVEAGWQTPEIDHIAVTVMADGLGMQGKLEEAITLVDSWAKRPWQKGEATKEAQKPISIDTDAANVLLLACGTAGKGRIAFRIWQAMQPRWGVFHDSISLTLLLQAANVEQTSVGRRGILAEGKEILSDGFRDLSMSFRAESKQEASSKDYEAYEASGFAKGSVSVFLDSEDVSYRSSRRATLECRRRARSLFRTILFTNWPDLEAVKSPLSPAGAWSAFNALRLVADDHPQPSIRLRRPPTRDARYTHIIPSASSFNAYVSVLAALESWTDIPLVFAWMKALSVAPSWFMMRKALLMIGESEGPKRYIQGSWKRDDEVLRDWLQAWVGEELGKPVPTEDDVAAVIKSRSAQP